MSRLLRRFISTALLAASALALINLTSKRGFQTVAPATLHVVLLCATTWLAHVVWHEGAHALAAIAANFTIRSVQFGPVLFVRVAGRWRIRFESYFGGRVISWPRGLKRLRSRVQLVAVAGPVATVLATSALALSVVTLKLPITSVAGVAFLMGLISIASALVPSAWRGSEQGTDIDQVLFRRRVEAAWTHAAVLDQIDTGLPLDAFALRERLERLLPPAPIAEPIVLVWALSRFKVGDFEEATARLAELVRAVHDREPPGWLLGDAALQCALSFALVKKSVTDARAMLPLIEEHQALPWFRLIVDAAIAHAEGDSKRAGELLSAWRDNADQSPGRRFAYEGCGWAIERLSGQRLDASSK